MWDCARCTYRHDGEDVHFLACACCGSERQHDSEDSNASAKRRRSDAGDVLVADRRAASSVQLPSGAQRTVNDVLVAQGPSAFVPLPRFRESPSQPWREMADDALASLVPLRVIRDVLPKDLADRLLRELVEHSRSWQSGTWYINNAARETARTTACFSLALAGEPATGVSRSGLSGADSHPRTRYGIALTPASTDLECAAAHIASKVRELRLGHDGSASDRVAVPLPGYPSDTPSGNSAHPLDWVPTFALANRYERVLQFAKADRLLFFSDWRRNRRERSQYSNQCGTGTPTEVSASDCTRTRSASSARGRSSLGCRSEQRGRSI